jgi:hypothetical protein
MPLDPTLARGFDLPKIESPIDQMGGVLRNAFAMEKLGASRRTRERDNAMRNVFSRLPQMRDGSGVDFAAAPQMLSEQGFGDEALAALSKLATVGKVKAETTNEGAKTAETEMKTNHERLKAKGTWLTNVRAGFGGVQVPEQAKMVLDAAANEAATMGVFTPEGAAKWRDLQSGLLDDSVKAGTFTKFLDDHRLGAKDAAEKIFTVLSGKDKNQVIASPKFASAPSVPVASVEAPERKGVTVNVGGGDKYADEMAKLKAAHDFAKGTSAEAAPAKISELERASSLVDRAFTGRGADWKESGSAWTGTNPDAVQATQELKQILSTDMLTNIGTLRTQFDVKLGSVTEKEFEQLRNTTPKITDSPATIKAWLQRAVEVEKKTIADYQRLAKRVSDNPVTAPVARAGMVPQPPAIPESPTNVFKDSDGDDIPPGAIAELRRNPKTAAMFDKTFGRPGLSTLILKGGGPTGRAPLPQ